VPLTLGATAASTVRENPARQTFADKQISSLLTGSVDRPDGPGRIGCDARIGATF
jgi:hypothetical protein